MEYQPGLPEHNDNITRTHPLKEFFVLLGGLGVLAVVIYLILGLLVDFLAEHISPEREQQWFKRSAIDVMTSSLLEQGGEAKPIEAKLFDDLKACMGIDYPLQLWYVNTDTVNAVAVPGGEIFVYQGLVDNVQSENGLAFVLAHEIAHFQQRDHLKSLGRGLVIASLLAIVGMDNAAALANPAAAIGQARYSQSREASADIKALHALACHYGHAGGATEFFDTLLKDQSRLTEIGHHFSTHPRTEARIQAIYRVAKEHNYTFAETQALPDFGEMFSTSSLDNEGEQ